jgi:hypothetical protein
VSGFKLDQRALKKIADEAGKNVISHAQPEFDRLHREHAGKPADDIVPHVRSMLQRLDWTGSPADIRRYAEAISAGKRIVLGT